MAQYMLFAWVPFQDFELSLFADVVLISRSPIYINLLNIFAFSNRKFDLSTLIDRWAESQARSQFTTSRPFLDFSLFLTRSQPDFSFSS